MGNGMAKIDKLIEDLASDLRFSQDAYENDRLAIIEYNDEEEIFIPIENAKVKYPKLIIESNPNLATEYAKLLELDNQ